ncbi:helix-turn-helix domain-containing protein [Lactobacillus sp. AN1001]
MAELNFSIGGVSVSVHSADADLLNELRSFNSNLTTVKKLLAHQSPHGGNLTETAKAWGVKPDTVKKWVKRGLPVVKLDGMNDYYSFASIAKWLQENEIAIET